MILVVAATEIEMEPFLSLIGDGRDCLSCVAGIGPVETSVRLTSFIQQSGKKDEIEAVVNFGVAGAYLSHQEVKKISLLDLCLAEREILGDFGICFEDHVEALPGELKVRNRFQLDMELLVKAKRILSKNNLAFHCGDFITVNCTSGTGKRGRNLFEQFGGLCENMEGAAIARVCEEFSLPLLEIRCISNMVEDRDVSRWKLREACEKAAYIAALLVKQL